MVDIIDKWLTDNLGEGMLATILSDLIKVLIAALIASLIYIILKVINTSFMSKSSKAVIKKLATTTHQKHLMMKTSVFMFFVLIYASFPKASSFFSIITLMIIVCDVLDVVNAVYTLNSLSKRRPIKGILQVAKIAVCILFGIILISLLLNQNPVVLISGVGAFTAVLSLVFKDAIVGLVAGLQITSENMLQIGDWISVPSLDVEGEVKDIALISVKVMGFDNIVYTLPTSTFQSTPFKNWHKTIETKSRQVNFKLSIDPESITKDGDETNLTRWRHSVLQKIKEDPHYKKNFATQCRTKGASDGFGIPVDIFFTVDIVNYDEYCEYTSAFGSEITAALKDFGLKPFKASSVRN